MVDPSLTLSTGLDRVVASERAVVMSVEQLASGSFRLLLALLSAVIGESRFRLLICMTALSEAVLGLRAPRLAVTEGAVPEAAPSDRNMDEIFPLF